jgi:hypothetical protein
MATIPQRCTPRQSRGCTIILTEEQSILYLEGGWNTFEVEDAVLDYLDKEGMTEPVAVVLSDRSAVAFYVTAPGVII